MIGRRGSGPSTRGRAWVAGAAVLLAVGLILAPPTAAPVTAATGRLLVSSAATYTVDPAAGVVHVSDVVTFRNDKPSDSRFFYYWRDLSWAIHPEATGIAIRDSSGPLKATPTAKDGYLEVDFRLRRNLLYRQTVKLTITWDLPGGAPRSESSIRVGEAFAAFDVWAWGDPGTSSVTAVLPAGFEVETTGSDLQESSTADGVTLTATAIPDTTAFWVGLTATREASMASDELTLAGGIKLTVRGWPEDTTWRTSVLSTLRRGMPALHELIGLPWPIDKRVDVTEVYSPLLEGYAGVFYTTQKRIEISEVVDTFVTVHEGAHAWFNQELFQDRWIDEGLADTYAAEVLVGMGEKRQSPDRPRGGDPGHVELLLWDAPGRITDETEDREAYGYNASWFVVSELYEELGPAKLTIVFQAASDSTIAYRGEGEPESVRKIDDWRRFLDLLEELAGSTTAETLFRDYVVTDNAAYELDRRLEARDAYEELLDAADGWLPPIYVREPLSAWSFKRAVPRIDEATAALERRDDVLEAAMALELEPGDAMEIAYESATDGFAELDAATAAELEALEVLAEADAAVEAEPDFVASIGLIGETPGATYDQAAAAYEAGDLAGAEAAAAAAIEVIEAAPRLGGERLTLAVGIAVGTGLLVLVAVLLLRRRRRRWVAALAATAATAAIAATDDAVAGTEPALAAEPSTAVDAVVGTEPAPAAEPPPAVDGAVSADGETFASGPYGTLAADSPAPPPEVDRAGGPDGGTADGEGSSAAS